MTETNTNVVEQTVRISARPETVWKYWTDPQRMCDWWGAAAELDPRPGGVCRVEMGGGRHGRRVSGAPAVRTARVQFRLGPTDGAPTIPPGASRVEVTLIEDAGDTILTLRHTGVPDWFAELHALGWLQFLPLLVAAVDEGRLA